MKSLSSLYNWVALAGRFAAAIAAALLALEQVAAAEPLPKGAKNEIVLIGGVNNIRHHDDQPFGAMQLRFAKNYCDIHPYLNAGVAGHGSDYAGAGLCYTFDLSRRLKFTVGTGPGWYRHEANDPNLGYAIEFSSWAELSTMFMGRRVGVSIAHLSNAHIGHTNPGTEAIGLNVHWKQW